MGHVTARDEIVRKMKLKELEGKNQNGRVPGSGQSVAQHLAERERERERERQRERERERERERGGERGRETVLFRVQFIDKNAPGVTS